MPDGQVVPPSAGGGQTTGPAPPPGAGQPPSAAPAGAQPALGRATGISPATQQTGQQGVEMEARVGASILANLMAQIAARLGLHSEVGHVLHKAAGDVAKVVPPGSIPPGAQEAFLQKLIMGARQNQTNVAAMRQQPGGAAAGGPQAGMAPPPMPRPPMTPQMGAGGSMPMAA